MPQKPIKAGRYVQLPDGKHGIVAHIGGSLAGQVSSGMQGPDGNPDSYDAKVGEGYALVHELDDNGETVMVKHPTLMKFISKEHLVKLTDLVPAEPHPARSS